MQLSIIIVNYNVQYFLEHCLLSIQAAIKDIEAEVFVVDNNSTDNSTQYLQPKFPWVTFIQNKVNKGFGAANNQVLQDCTGEYILFLNPDTIVPEKCFTTCINFFNQHNDCGAIGVKMVDGSGNFLPESKRAFPTLTASFFKIIGLAKIFPKSKLFNRYALGFLDENSNHRVDVLAGAFLMLSKPVIDDTKGFDEDFFMYGEDVDLSYRIQQMGYQNYYVADTTIIHFKGESTKKSSFKYVKHFYNAMSIFVQKNYTGSNAKRFLFFIKIAIWVKGFTSLVKSFFFKIGLPFFDALIILASFFTVEKLWVYFVRDGLAFNQNILPFIMVLFTVIFLIAATFSGIYDNLYKPLKACLACIVGITITIAAYSLFPEFLRFSRGVVICGGMLAAASITISRWLLIAINWIEKPQYISNHQFTTIVANKEEYEHTFKYFTNSNTQDKIIGRVSPVYNESNCIGSIENLVYTVQNLSIKEVIFCNKSLTYQDIIKQIQVLKSKVHFSFSSIYASSIISSHSKATTGEIIALEGNYAISNPYQKRMKRLLDILWCFYLLVSLPINILFLKKSAYFYKNIMPVLIGRKTWIGYMNTESGLPISKPFVLNCSGLPLNSFESIRSQSIEIIQSQYAKNYTWWQDVQLITKYLYN